MSDQLTVGVEEEFFLVDSATARTVPQGPAVARSCRDAPCEVKTEFTPAQIELATGVCSSLAQVRAQLLAGRGFTAARARRHGALLVASGTPPLDEPGPPPVTDSSRYRWLTDRYRRLAERQGVCGCHVHIGMSDADASVQVSNQIRPWLPVLLALTANSPYCAGRDTGYASWRSVLWGQWPVSGMPPFWDSALQYESLTRALVDTGAIADPRMAYWHVRPSPRVPTIEIRVADVTPTVDDAVLLAGLVRGLVATAMDDVEHGRPAARFPEPLGRVACWRAARDGMAGTGLDLVGDRLLPAWDLAGLLVEHVRSALVRVGDVDTVTRGLARLRLMGCGAQRQRAAHRRRGDLSEVVSFLADATTADDPLSHRGEGPPGPVSCTAARRAFRPCQGDS